MSMLIQPSSLRVPQPMFRERGKEEGFTDMVFKAAPGSAAD
jgi:hypothetical protein